jgi:hypothetical protein
MLPLILPIGLSLPAIKLKGFSGVNAPTPKMAMKMNPPDIATFFMKWICGHAAEAD